MTTPTSSNTHDVINYIKFPISLTQTEVVSNTSKAFTTCGIVTILLLVTDLLTAAVTWLTADTGLVENRS